MRKKAADVPVFREPNEELLMEINRLMVPERKIFNNCAQRVRLQPTERNQLFDPPRNRLAQDRRVCWKLVLEARNEAKVIVNGADTLQCRPDNLI